MTKAKPNLRDIDRKSKYESGDRVVVRVGQTISAEQRRTFEKVVNASSGVDLNLLIVECHLMEIVLVRDDKPIMLLAGLDHVRNTPMTNQVNLGGSKVELQSMDSLEVYTRHSVNSIGGRDCIRMVQKWAGNSVIVRQMPWRF